MSVKVITFVKITDFNTPIRVVLVSNKQIHETVSRPKFVPLPIGWETPT